MSDFLHPDRLFSTQPDERNIARRLYKSIRDLPIISPHGHTDPAWFAQNRPFTDAANLLFTPDHYLFRMLYSAGVPLERLGIARNDSNGAVEADARAVWRLFAEHYFRFQGTPSRVWLDHALGTVFGLESRLGPDNCDAFFDRISEQLQQPAYRPRALFERFNIEVLATTESPLDPLHSHQAIASSGWSGRVITTYRPDPVVDPGFEGFTANVLRFGELTGEDTSRWAGYLAAHRARRIYFRDHGATATDHGHPSATTSDLDTATCQQLLDRALSGSISSADADRFRGQVLTEMALMSLDDGLVMQLHPGSFRNHNATLFESFGRDMGADLPSTTDFVRSLKPLLDRVGNDPRLTLILFTLDETTCSRELAPLAGHYPCIRLGPPWWFFDSVEGMLRYKRAVIETAGFYNTAGFNDDTRAFLSIPARHDVARRVDCRHLAELVCEHRMDEDEAFDLVRLLATDLARQSYRLGE